MAKYSMTSEMLTLTHKESPLTPEEFILLGTYLDEWWAKHPELKQADLAKLLKMPLRQMQRIVSAGRWPKKVKHYILLHDEKFSQTALKKFADQSWIGKRQANGKDGKKLKRKVSYFKTQALLSALERHANQVKDSIRVHKPKHLPSANIRYIEEALRSKLMIKTEILEDSKTILIPCGNWEQLDRVYREICH